MTNDEESLFADAIRDVIASDDENVMFILKDTRRLLAFLENEAIRRGLVVYE